MSENDVVVVTELTHLHAKLIGVCQSVNDCGTAAEAVNRSHLAASALIAARPESRRIALALWLRAVKEDIDNAIAAYEAAGGKYE